jgi:hypothetical protein
VSSTGAGSSELATGSGCSMEDVAVTGWGESSTFVVCRDDK